MFRMYDEQCDRFNVHESHWSQKGFLWTDTVYCPGIKKEHATDWMKADPRLGNHTANQVIADGGVPPHKHFFKLTNLLVVDSGIRRYYQGLGHYNENIYWQCECLAAYWRDRIALKEEMRPAWANVDQTWPQ